MASFDALFAPFVPYVDCLGSVPLAEAATCTVTTAVVAAALATIGVSVLCYVLSWITGNDSWVDRLWSIVPVIHAWLYVWFDKDPIVVQTFSKDSPVPWLPTARGGFAIVATIWGIRLTFNFWRRGGYASGGEDYRWEVIRAWPIFRRSRLLWHLFSFAFISVYQQWLLWAITWPLLSLPAGVKATEIELALMAAMLFFIVLETIADQQQWRFQNEKYNKPGFVRRDYLARDYRNGFLTHGLFARSRHPNVWSEQQIWLMVYLVSVLRWGSLNWSVLGVLNLVMLTVRSCWFTEEISVSKYADKYRAYQQVVPMLLISPFARSEALTKKLDAAPEPEKKRN